MNTTKSIRILAGLLGLALLAGPVSAQTENQEVGGIGNYDDERRAAGYQDQGYQDPAADSGFDYSQVDLRVGLWMDRDSGEIYRRGENQEIGFQTNSDAYAVVYRIDAEGLVTVLWPRSRMDDGFVFGGHEYNLPVPGSPPLRVASATGEGFVEALVSRYPFDLRKLEIDFHHENIETGYQFYVAGDPFLAMNEVNYAVTGLEDSGEYVVTNYLNYYVHQEVEHPRYLCSQCHTDETASYDPYRDECTLNITYDHQWSNSWYDAYGYYPVYYNPVYVYVDPWTWRPWVNFWYWPSYTCAPYYGWYGSYYNCYSWSYSPYYYGDCYTTYASGSNTRYRPLDRTRTTTGTVKTREYARASSKVRSDEPDGQTRQAMATRTAMKNSNATSGRGAITVAGRGEGRAPRGERAAERSRVKYSQNVRTQGKAGLRIRNSGTVRNGQRTSASSARTPDRKHTAAGSSSRSQFAPVSRGSSVPVRGQSGFGSTVGGSRQSSGSGQAVRPQSQGSRSIKSVEPRKKGTRVWSSSRGSGSTGRGQSTANPRSGKAPSTRGTNTRNSNVKAGRTPKQVKSGSRNIQSGTKSSGKSGSRSSGAVKSGSSSSGSRSSGSKGSSRGSAPRSGSSSRGGSSRGGSSRGGR